MMCLWLVALAWEGAVASAQVALDVWSQLQKVDATWAEALGTIAAFAVALLALWVNVLDKRKNQPRLVHVWLGDDPLLVGKDTPFEAKGAIGSRADEPVTVVPGRPMQTVASEDALILHIEIQNRGEDVITDIEGSVLVNRRLIHGSDFSHPVLLPNSDPVPMHIAVRGTGIKGPHFRINPQVRFTDSAGRRWRRRLTGSPLKRSRRDFLAARDRRRKGGVRFPYAMTWTERGASERDETSDTDSTGGSY